MKTGIQRMLLLLLSLVLLTGSGVARADSESESSDAVHFVLVIDCTGSMDKADSEKMSVAAAELFVDMIPMENATISVLCFGKLWKSAYEFKSGALEEMQPFLSEDGEYYGLVRADSRYVTSLCELDGLDSVTERSRLKNAIENAESYASANTITVANSAMLAAVDLLKSVNAEAGNACIVLMSDGRVQVGRREAMDAVTALNPYPSYVLELNYDQLNTDSSHARKQLSDVAAKYDGDRDSNRYIEVKSAGDVIQAVSAVIGRFIDLQAVNPTKVEVIDGESAEYSFFVPEMASETNVVVTGEGFSSMEVVSPDGTTATYERTSTEDPDNTFIRNGDKYAVLKIKRPTLGEWSVKINGESGSDVYIHAVSAKELGLMLRASGYEPESRDTWLKNDVIPFTAAFEYEGDIVTSESFYIDHPAELYLKNSGTNQQIGPILSTGSQNGYSWSVPLQEAGEMDAYAVLNCDVFRDGKKVSNDLVYDVQNLAVTFGGGGLTLPDTQYVNQTSDPIDVSGVFLNPDEDEVSYTVSCRDENSLSGDMCVTCLEPGVIELTMPSTAGTFTGMLSARDDDMAEPVTVGFTVTVVNRPIEVLKKLTVGPLVRNRPEWLKSADDGVYELNEYFEDPDGLPLDYALQTGENDGEAVSISLNGSVLTASALNKGSEQALLSVTDSSGDTREIELNVKSESWLFYLIEQNLILLGVIAVLIALVWILASVRRVKGGWEISASGPDGTMPTARFTTLASQKSMKKSKVSLKKLLRCAEGQSYGAAQSLPDLNPVGGSPILHGTLFGKKVRITGLDRAHSRADEVLVDGKPVDRKKAVVMERGKNLELRYRSGEEETLSVKLKMY